MTRVRYASVATLTALLALAALSAQAQTQGTNSFSQRSLFADRKAHRTGDMLTVLITESAAANATAQTTTNKDDNAFAFLTTPDSDKRWGGGIRSDFKGGGQIQRTGQLLARLAVVVDSIDVNGNLTIRGEQDIRVNNERQRIALTGVIRSEDIAPDNTIQSSRISQAKIEFKGDGVLARRQKPGIISRIFSLFGLN
jgi:flagellar L-ring protein FlgH